MSWNFYALTGVKISMRAVISISVGSSVLALFIGMGAYAFSSGADVHLEAFDADTSRGHISRKIKIESRIEDDKWKKHSAIYPLSGQKVALRVKKQPHGVVRWYMILADITQNYNNANRPFTPNAYQWTGYDQIDYYRVELKQVAGKWEIHPFENQVLPFEQISKWFIDKGRDKSKTAFYNPRVGTFWFQAEVDVNGKTIRSYGMEDVGDKGLSPKVFRVSMRPADSYLGWVASHFNIPGIFGSVIYQSKNYIGADCADILMSAWSRWKKKRLKKNYNVQMLLTKFPQVGKFKIENGTPDIAVKWGETVRPGDLIAVRYGDEGKKFHHIGVLYKDENQNGILDSEDSVLHAGPDPLHLTQFKYHPFDGHIVVLRP